MNPTNLCFVLWHVIVGCQARSTSISATDRPAGDAVMLAQISAIDPVHAESMRNHTTTLSSDPLPFFRDGMLVRAVIALPHHPREARYVAAQGRLYVLGQTERDLAAVNAAAQLELRVDNVAAYVVYYFANLRRGETSIVQTHDELAALCRRRGTPVPTGTVRPVSVARRADRFFVAATAVRRDTIVDLSLEVNRSGTVSAAR
jgi:hypothetical protein